MNQKEAIIQKLFNDEALLHEELVYVSSNLQDGAIVGATPFKHDEKGTFEACGVTKEDANRINKSFSELIDASSATTISEIVEKVEILANSDIKFKRLIYIQAVQYTLEKNAMKGSEGAIKSLIEGFLKRKRNEEDDEEK